MTKHLLTIAVTLFSSVIAFGQPALLPRHKDYLEVMCKRLSAEETARLRMIYEPAVVAVPPSNARAYVCIMPDGEIRSYGTGYRTPGNPEGIPVYLSSYDCGLSWKEHFAGGTMGAATYFPEIGLWAKCGWEADGVFISSTGPDDPSPDLVPVDGLHVFDCFLPQKLETRDRYYFTAQTYVGDVNCAAFIYSDDGLRSFNYSLVPQPAWRGFSYPDMGTRWCIGSGCEPYVCQLDNDRLMMIMRTPADCFYQSFSDDCGTTWSEPEPSPFHGTDTTPFLLPLSDGRILCFWNNTRPMPELDHYSQPGVPEGVITGCDEDFFTNRDAAHVAVSDDGGRSWHSRELYLNGIRNNADYRYIGSPLDSRDKSVHQFQAYELPFNKVLVSLGQNEAARRMLVFDLDWLYESSASEDFFSGLGNVSTQVYLKSYASYTPGNGHCAYNRTNGAVMAVDPVGGTKEVVQISRIEDPRLLNNIQGIVWNFPSASAGSVSVELLLAQDAVNISFDDCWSNPCDPTEPCRSLFSFHLTGDALSDASYHTLRFDYDLEAGTMSLFIDGGLHESRCISRPFSIGLSYVNIQCDAPSVSEGVFVRSLDSKAGL